MNISVAGRLRRWLTITIAPISAMLFCCSIFDYFITVTRTGSWLHVNLIRNILFSFIFMVMVIRLLVITFYPRLKLRLSPIFILTFSAASAALIWLGIYETFIIKHALGYFSLFIYSIFIFLISLTLLTPPTVSQSEYRVADHPHEREAAQHTAASAI